MDIQRWVAQREKSWQDLERLLAQAERRGLRTLSAQDIQNLASLYRSVSADLARARTHNLGPDLMRRLQSLTVRGYAQIYQGDRRQEWRSLLTFIQSGFPETVQQCRGYILLSTLLLVAPAAVSWWLAWHDPTYMDILVPNDLITMVRRGELWMGSILGVEPLASSNIMINNLRVSFNAVAGGMTGGLLTVYILIFNGLFLGSIGALVGQNGLAWPFWAFVFPHGALELPAIFLAGGAGLLLGRALLFPGLYRRVDALKKYGLLAARLVYGVVPMLIMAGVIEGFFSPNPAIPDVIKYITGIVLLTGLLAYLSRRSHPSGSLHRTRLLVE
ncbi:stage II sporulation protein M [Leptolyngbya sp. CCY15150]|uniref:stage II sporulation protein M n=1 Tax=Leptolyngbya sp. CCY15150 TaxID=2767772 RepID=UPI00194F88BC|nr:stage II sporulation protein M [Leptolyngbya sp. CCY15150]